MIAPQVYAAKKDFYDSRLSLLLFVAQFNLSRTVLFSNSRNAAALSSKGPHSFSAFEGPLGLGKAPGGAPLGAPRPILGHTASSGPDGVGFQETLLAGLSNGWVTGISGRKINSPSKVGSYQCS